MSNIHTPQRLQGETFSDYKERRAQSRQIAEQQTRVKSGTETSRQALRNAQRASGAMKQNAGSFGRGLRNSITRKQAAALQR